jgi:threonine/homoserine/homoserine lactone efflux protein
MSVKAFELLLGLAFFCAGSLLALFNKTAARKAIEQHRRWLERPSTEVVTRIAYIVFGLFFAAFGVLFMLGKVIK